MSKLIKRVMFILKFILLTLSQSFLYFSNFLKRYACSLEDEKNQEKKSKETTLDVKNFSKIDLPLELVEKIEKNPTTLISKEKTENLLSPLNYKYDFELEFANLNSNLSNFKMNFEQNYKIQKLQKIIGF